MPNKKVALLVVMLAGSSYAIDADLESFVRGSNGASTGLVQNKNAEEVIPNYSANSASQAGRDFDINDSELKSKANQKILEASSSKANDSNNPSAETIALNSLARKPIENFENLDAFKKAEAIYQDPVSLLKKITEADCSERLNNSQNHYTKESIQKEYHDIEYEEKTCEKPNDSITCTKMLTVTCDAGGQGECDMGGIVADSIQSKDVSVVHNKSVLTIGTIQRELWRGRCAVFDRTVNFKIKNKHELTEFRIFEIGYDDYIWIKVNDKTVFVGPDGGDRIELVDREQFIDWRGLKIRVGTERKVYNGQSDSDCERLTDWLYPTNPQSPHKTIDLIEHLKEGDNTIWMRVIVSGSGEGWMKIRARQNCCNKFIDSWETTCTAKQA